MVPMIPILPRYGAVEPTAVRLPIEALEDPPSFEVATVELFGPFQAEKMVEIDGHSPSKHQAIGDLTNEQIWTHDLGVRRTTNPKQMQFNAFTKGEHDDSSPDFGHLFPGRPIVRVEKYSIGSGTKMG